VEQEVHHIVYYLDSMDLVEHGRKVVFVVEDNKKKEQHNLKNIVDDIVEDVMEEVEAVVDEKYVELVMTKDI
jgi:DNA-binding cell septation regulator SpoVG